MSITLPVPVPHICQSKSLTSYSSSLSLYSMGSHSENDSFQILINPLVPEVFSLKNTNWPEANFNNLGYKKQNV